MLATHPRPAPTTNPGRGGIERQWVYLKPGRVHANEAGGDYARPTTPEVAEMWYG